MKKIFKYDFNSSSTMLPKGSIVIRTDTVKDAFYDGTYIWAVVEVGEEELVFWRSCDDWRVDKNASTTALSEVPLLVKEKQKVKCGQPVFAKETVGQMNIYCLNGEESEHEIAVYKTGQEIDLPIDKLKYLGCNKLYIVQELCLYTFLLKK